MKQTEDTLSQISRHLMLQVNTIDNIGLINGKMGIAIFFYHYANYTRNMLYSNFARELVDDIYIDINPEIPWRIYLAAESKSSFNDKEMLIISTGDLSRDKDLIAQKISIFMKKIRIRNENT